MDNTMSLMLEKILQRIESLAAVTAELKENSIEQNDKIDRLAADSFEIKEELKKLNVKVEKMCIRDRNNGLHRPLGLSN